MIFEVVVTGRPDGVCTEHLIKGYPYCQTREDALRLVNEFYAAKVARPNDFELGMDAHIKEHRESDFRPAKLAEIRRHLRGEILPDGPEMTAQSALSKIAVILLDPARNEKSKPMCDGLGKLFQDDTRQPEDVLSLMTETLVAFWQRQDELAEALDNYTNPKHPEYDPEFDREIRKLAPHWFGPTRARGRRRRST